MSFYNYNTDDIGNNDECDDGLLLGYIHSPSSPKLINDNVMEELCKYFKLNNLVNMIRFDENTKPKHDVTISNTIMNTIINKKLGTITYHYSNRISKKAYHTYDYPEIYYDKKLYNNPTEWIKEEFMSSSKT